MAKVKVWNDNKHPHIETYKGDKITIPAGEFIEMDWEEAIQFKGQFTGMAPIGEDGAEDPRFFKMIRVEAPAEDPVKDDGLVNHATGKRADSAEQLLGQLLAFARANPDAVVKDKDLDKVTTSSSEVGDLKRQVAELTALVKGGSVKKKPGPKPKGAVA